MSLAKYLAESLRQKGLSVRVRGGRLTVTARHPAHLLRSCLRAPLGQTRHTVGFDRCDCLRTELPVEAQPWAPATTIHRAPCEHCPSAHAELAGVHDPESTDIKERWSRAEQIASVFHCGWRQTKACKGYCDYLGVTEADLVAAAESAVSP